MDGGKVPTMGIRRETAGFLHFTPDWISHGLALRFLGT